MAPVIHVWVERAWCPVCSTYFWTNPNAGTIICECGSSWITDHVRGGQSATIPSATAFRNAVCTELAVASADLDLTQGTP